jgi:syntaxin-binding protein 5
MPLLLTRLVGGPNRPPSKRMIEQLRAEESQRREAGRRGSPARAGSPGQPAPSDETYWAYMQRQVQERTERLGIAGDNMERLEESSAGWADDVSKFVSQQKRKAVMGCELALSPRLS